MLDMTSKSGERMCDEADVILEAKRIQEEALGSSFRQDAEIWDETRRKECEGGVKSCGTEQSNGTISKNLLNDWDMVLALTVDDAWEQEIDVMAMAWITTSMKEERWEPENPSRAAEQRSWTRHLCWAAPSGQNWREVWLPTKIEIEGWAKDWLQKELTGW